MKMYVGSSRPRSRAALSGLRVERVRTLASPQFLSRYYARNKPVVWENFWQLCPQVKHWSPRSLAERFGEVSIKVMTALQQYPNYVSDGHQHSATMTLRDFVDRIECDPAGGDFYLVAQCHALQQTPLASLLGDLTLDRAIFKPDPWGEQISLWMGPGNTVTPLHYDLRNQFLGQVYGRKRVKLISPLDTARLYNHRGGYSQVDPEQRDPKRFPLFEGVSVCTVDLDAGDALFLPFGWWHHVRSLSPSISLSIGSFVWPNSFATAG